MKTNPEFFKKYSWIKDVAPVPESLGVTIYTTFDPYMLENQFHVETDEWESEDEDEIASALEYIDHVYHEMVS